MGKKSSPSPPPAPDPIKTAQAQGAANKEAAIASAELAMVDQYTPFGQLVYSPTGTSAEGTPQYQATQTLAPEQQAILDRSQGLDLSMLDTAQAQLGRVSDALSEPIDFSGAPALTTDFSADRQRVEDALMDRMNIYIDRDRDRLETRLANQGIADPGSVAYRDAIDEMNRQSNDARMSAILNAGQEQSRLDALNRSARQQYIQETLAERQTPINEIGALSSGSQVQLPNFVPTPSPTIGPAPVADAIYGSYNAQLNNYNQQLANRRSANQGLFGLIGTGAGALLSTPAAGSFFFSDRRLKTGIVHLGQLKNGLNVYRYQYKWGGQAQIGLMADEVRAVRPEAVLSICGYDAVNYTEAVR